MGLLVLLLVATGAMPAGAGAAGPPGGGSDGRNGAGARPGGGQQSGVTAQQGSGGSAPAARKSQGPAPRPARQSASAGPRAAKPAAAASSKPPAAKPAAAKPAAAKPAAAKAPKPAERKPGRQDDAPEPDRKVDDGPAPHRKVDDGTPHRRTEVSPVHRPRAEVRSSAVLTARRAVSRAERPSRARATVRPVAPVVTSAADPSASLFTPPPVVRMQAVAGELEPRQLWPNFPGPAGHPAFPGFLAAVLLGFVALGFRGDRRDPKLAAAAIDDRDDRAEFR